MADHDPARGFAAVIARAISDDAFRIQLTTDPSATLQAAGLDVPRGMTVTVVQNTPTHVHLVLPDPDGFSDEMLAGAAGGSGPVGPTACGACFPCASSTLAFPS